MLVTITLTVLDTPQNPARETSAVSSAKPANELWQAPNESLLLTEANADEIKYGRELIQNTALYLGPNGTVKQISNGMNCQNCHLDAGTKAWGNNYAAVYSTYPKFRERSGALETIPKRVNDCFERSLNGQSLDTNSKEMLAIVAYIKWLGVGLNKGDKPAGSGIVEVPFLNRPASPEKGQLVYKAKCENCHQANGEGLLNADKNTYAFPPLWGENSYNSGAGLYRLSRFAGYVKANMPLGASYNNPILSDEEAWDVAAFVNTQKRPSKDLSKDWPNIAGKPIDHPFGPFADGFSEEQHKYGPFEPIKKKRNELKNKKTT
ncbi:MAG: c-type cytochrome [Bacteroidia bacterium]